MEEYDHHCPVVGVCIARRNHRWFIGMWLAAGVAGVIGFVGCVLRIIDIKEKYVTYSYSVVMPIISPHPFRFVSFQRLVWFGLVSFRFVSFFSFRFVSFCFLFFVFFFGGGQALDFVSFSFSRKERTSF